MTDLARQLEFWLSSASKNWQTALSLYKLGHYDMCLFCCHLTLEKKLKAIIVYLLKKVPPPIHDLNRLAQIAGLNVSLTQQEQLNEITKFNIQARYDDIKLAFYKKATKLFAKKYLEITQELILWLEKKSGEK
ncbi:HEPN domain-containing protein [Patescibacteria group bacterium]|nr:MAG: HEPN domain-containing protein [Patescibacteria group bacterium]